VAAGADDATTVGAGTCAFVTASRDGIEATIADILADNALPGTPPGSLTVKLDSIEFMSTVYTDELVAGS
jgi:hypothetical protein